MDQERENHLCDWVEDRALNKDRNSRFPGLHWWPSGKESTWQYRSREFDPWVRNIPWRRKWQPTPVLLSGKSRGRRSLAGHSPWERKRAGHNWATKQQQSRLPGKKMKDSVYNMLSKITVWSISKRSPPALQDKCLELRTEIRPTNWSHEYE